MFITGGRSRRRKNGLFGTRSYVVRRCLLDQQTSPFQCYGTTKNAQKHDVVLVKESCGVVGHAYFEDIWEYMHEGTSAHLLGRYDIAEYTPLIWRNGPLGFRVAYCLPAGTTELHKPSQHPSLPSLKLTAIELRSEHHTPRLRGRHLDIPYP